MLRQLTAGRVLLSNTFTRSLICTPITRPNGSFSKNIWPAWQNRPKKAELTSERLYEFRLYIGWWNSFALNIKIKKLKACETKFQKQYNKRNCYGVLHITRISHSMKYSIESSEYFIMCNSDQCCLVRFGFKQQQIFTCNIKLHSP